MGPQAEAERPVMVPQAEAGVKRQRPSRTWRSSEADSKPTDVSVPTLPAAVSVVLVIVDGVSAGRVFPVAGAVSIGRDSSAGIVIDDDQVSRRHAVVTADGDGARVDDLDSTNGTWVNGERVRGPRRIGAGDELRIGHTSLRVHAVTRGGDTPLPREVVV